MEGPGRLQAGVVNGKQLKIIGKPLAIPSADFFAARS